MNRAFTLIEVIITLSLFVVMLLTLVEFYINTNSEFVYEKSYVEVARGADDIVNAVGAYALPGDQIPEIHNFSIGTYQAGTTTLVLEVPSITSSGGIIANTYDYVLFYSVGSKVYRRVEAGTGSARRTATRLLSENVSSLSFTYDSPDLTQAKAVTVNVQTTAVAKGTTLTQSLSHTFRLRNAPDS